MIIALIVRLLFLAINIYTWVLVIYALMSWVPQIQQSKVGWLIARISQPYLSLFDRLPLQFAGLDFTVLVAIISLQLIERFITIVLGMILL